MLDSVTEQLREFTGNSRKGISDVLVSLVPQARQVAPRIPLVDPPRARPRVFRRTLLALVRKSRSFDRIVRSRQMKSRGPVRQFGDPDCGTRGMQILSLDVL